MKPVTRQVVKTPARTQERVIPAVTKQVTRRVVKTPASTVETSGNEDCYAPCC